MLNIALEHIQRPDSLDKGRKISNDNDDKLAAYISGGAIPAYVHSEPIAALTWTVNHPLETTDYTERYEDLTGETIRPRRAYWTSNSQIIVEWTVAQAGRAIYLAGNSALADPATNPVGLPTDGTWDDGPAIILESDTIVDAIDKINMLLGRLFLPPNNLSGNPEAVFSPGTEFRSGYISSGVSQNLSFLSAGQLFANVFPSTIFLATPLSPTSQFGWADRGTLEFWVDGVLLDYIGLGDLFDEARRETGQIWPTLNSFGAPFTNTLVNYLEMTSIGMYLNIPKYQKGQFLVTGVPGTWVQDGELRNILLKHVTDAATYQTTPLLVFKDAATPPAINGTPEVDEASLTSSKYLDGIRFYSVGDVLAITSSVIDPAFRTYAAEPIRFELTGLPSTDVPYADTDAAWTAASDFLADDFSAGSINTIYWSTPLGPPVQNSGLLKMIHTLAGTPKSFQAKSIPIFVKKSGWSISATVVFGAGSFSGDGWEVGIRLEGPTGGRIELIFHHATGGAKTVEIYSQADGAPARTLENSAVVAAGIGDTLVLTLINNIGTNNYAAEYDHNGGGATSLGSAFGFTGWAPNYTNQLTPSLYATNQNELTLSAFDVAFDDYTPTSGRATTLLAIPDINDSWDSLAKLFTLSIANERSINARLLATPLSPRGEGVSVQSASANRLISTYGNVSTRILELFEDNNWRLPDADYSAAAPPALTGQWDDTIVLPTGEAQVYNGGLRYPSINFTSGYAPTQAGRNYSGRVGAQTYDRGFLPANPKVAGLLKLNGPGTLLADLASGDITLELTIPTFTGWLDLLAPYQPSLFTGADGDGINASLTSPSSGIVELVFTLGGFSTQLPASANLGAVVVRVTLLNSSAPVLTRMEMVGW